MRKSDWMVLCLLLGGGALLWLREAAQAALPVADVLPLVLAFPLFFQLGRPWKFRVAGPIISLPLLAVAGGALAAGWLADLAVATALGWTLALAAWLQARTEPPQQSRLHRLLVLPVLGFPWLVGAGGLGWYFRLSAAWVAEQCFSLTGFPLLREGTLLTVQGEPLSVEAACAGLGSLQAMLLAGMAAALIELGGSPRFWLSLPLLVAAAWVANTLRVLVISATALSAGPAFASGTFHGLAGLAVLVIIYLGCLAIFRAWQPRRVVSRQHQLATPP
jgi:exosortase/archaeosortase family protein